MVALLSSVTVSLLCLRLRRIKNTDNLSTSTSGSQYYGSTVDTLKSRLSLKSEYIHSNQARIP